jgi:enediyne biosynthesis protein E4
MNEPPSLLRNEYAGKNHWIEVQLEGTVSNRSAIGALVTVKVNGRSSTRALLSQSSYYSHDDVRLHFGLGSSDTAQSIVIRWPSGSLQSLVDVQGDRVVRIREPTR